MLRALEYAASFAERVTYVYSARPPAHGVLLSFTFTTITPTTIYDEGTIQKPL
jgi:hypothetical protein